ncbi:serine/threonine protein kinase [Bacillus salinus]|uniref:serine/threonine protein kinase n=1 Tax=Bacillus sp. HMF5848 TaxID=2495421 RepID=UPI00163992C5|nr:protein kinase [Bacillus sp. HMF5848]
MQKILGMGSYGITYLAEDTHSSRLVAMKQLRYHKQKTDAGVFSFKREQEIMQKLSHPNIPAFIENFTNNTSKYLIFEYIDGVSFEELLFEKNVTFSEKEAFQIIDKITDIVQYLHDNDIVHRDLRVSNIMLANDEIFIIDFGLARYLFEQNDFNYTQTPYEKYMQRRIHVRSDFYTLGHFILFLLYSNYEPEIKRERPWFEELKLSSKAINLINRLLEENEPYDNIIQIKKDIKNITEEVH